MSDTASATLGEWLRFRNGRTPPERTPDAAYPVFGSNGVIGRASEVNVSGESVVIGRVGSYCGSTYYSSSSCWVTDNAIVATSEEPDETRFWYYVLTSLDLNRRSQGSGQPLLNQSILSTIPFVAPERPERLRIAATLGALDDKIESNRRLVKLIPELIRVRVLAAMNAGSDAVPVSSLATFVNGGAYTNGASGAGRMVIRIAELNGGPGGSTVYNDIDVPDDKTARPGDILMSWSGSLGVYRWARNEAIVNQHIFKVIPDGYPAWLVFDRVDAVIDVFQGIARDKATTMGHIQRGHLDTTLVDMPMTSAISQLDLDLEPLWDRLQLAEREALTLAELRDVLLGKLLSGRLRVAESGAR